MLKFTPREIQKQEFSKVFFRGYDRVEVDTYLEMVSDEFELMLRVKKELEDKVLKYETELKNFRQVEGTLQETLIEAKRTSAESKESSIKEADMILRDAELKAKEITEDAHREIKKLKDGIILLKSEKDSFVRRLKQLLKSHIDLIKILELDEKMIPESGKFDRRRRKGNLPENASFKPAAQYDAESETSRLADQKTKTPSAERIAAQTSTRQVRPPEIVRPEQSSGPSIQQKAEQIPSVQPAKKPPLTSKTPLPQVPSTRVQQERKVEEADTAPVSRIQNGFDLIDKIIDEEEEKDSNLADND